MMKKITKLALLAVAAAFLVAALPACSSGSSDDDDTTQGSGGGGTGGSGGGGGGSVELTFPLSIKPTQDGSTPEYPSADGSDLSSATQFVFTSPIAYTVCTKKKFDTGKINTGSGTETVSRWNLGGGLKTNDGKYNQYMKFDSAPSAKMTVTFFNTNVDRTLTVVSGTTETVGTVKTTKTDGTNGDLMSETFTVTKGSEVYLGATASGIWVTEIVWEE